MSDKEKSATIKTPSKIQSFEEVQKALQDLAKQITDLGIATNSSAEGEVTDKDGKTGDIRITQNTDKTYGLELKTDEGWKFPTVGESPVQLTGKKGEKARPDVVVDNFKDDLGNPKNMPKPDYDSGFFDVGRGKQYVTGATTGVVPDDSFIYDAGDVIGIPELGFKLVDFPSNIMLLMVPTGVRSFEDAISTKCICWLTQNQYYPDNAMGANIVMTSSTSVSVNTAGAYLMHNHHYGGNPIRSDYTSFYQAFDASSAQHTACFRLLLWR